MPGRIFYKNILRTLDPSYEHAGWNNTHRLTDESPRLCAMATGTSGTEYVVAYDLGSARSVYGAAVVNHNMGNVGMQYFRLHTGSADDGLTWDELRFAVGDLQTYPAYSPSFAGVFSSAASRRHWRFTFSLSTSATAELYIGQLCLFNACGILPTAPCSPLRVRGLDSAVVERGLGGYEGRHDAGVGALSLQMRWQREPGGVSVATQVRDILRWARRFSQWTFEPVCWVPHDAEKPNPTYDAHPCAYCVMEDLADAEVLTVGSTRRYDVSLRLRELTFDGLL